MAFELGRIERLARRVGWLDRHRRKLAVIATFIATPFIIDHLAESLERTRFYPTLLGLLLATLLWVAIEIAFAWIIAVWETECARLMADRSLPRAVLLRAPKTKTAA